MTSESQINGFIQKANKKQNNWVFMFSIIWNLEWVGDTVNCRYWKNIQSSRDPWSLFGHGLHKLVWHQINPSWCWSSWLFDTFRECRRTIMSIQLQICLTWVYLLGVFFLKLLIQSSSQFGWSHRTWHRSEPRDFPPVQWRWSHWWTKHRHTTNSPPWGVQMVLGFMPIRFLNISCSTHLR